MVVYHGSDMVVESPDVTHAIRNLDFGKGFYVTTVREQAERWARRKADFSGRNPIVNIYEWKEGCAGIKVKDFRDALFDWIDFVCDC